MTRDTKLALVVGFALVLAVGVLISDHFASGNRGQPADLAGAAMVGPLEPRSQDSPPTRERRGTPTAPGGGPSGIATDGTGVGMGASGPSGEIGDQKMPPDVAGAEPVTFWQGRTQAGDRAAGLPARGLLPHERDAAAESGRGGLEEGGAIRLGSDGRVVPEEARIQTIPLAQLEQTLARNAGRMPSREQEEGGRWHVVREGESLWKIAELYYAKGSAWGEIARANPDRVDEDGVVRAGVRIRLPEPRAIGLSGWGESGGASPAPASKGTNPKGEDLKAAAKPARTPVERPGGEDRRSEAVVGGGVRTYTVRKGETLGQIAQRELGRASRMEEIVRLNADQIRDADEIRAGMVLRLPK